MRIRRGIWLLAGLLSTAAVAGEPRITLEGHRDAVTCLAYAPDGKTLATGTGGYLYDKQGKLVVQNGAYVWTDCVLRLWEMESGKELHALKGFKTGVYGTHYTPDNKRLLFYCQGDTQTRSRDAANPTSAETTAFPGIPLGFGFSPDAKTLLCWHNGGYGFDLYDAATRKKTYTFTCPETMGNVHWANDCRHLIVPLRTGVVYVLRVGSVK